MAHTDRDDERQFWKRHYGTSPRGGRWKSDCTLYTDRGGRWNAYLRGSCWCDKVHNMWTRPYHFEAGVPSGWNRDCRREERAKARNLMDRARAGHIDWDDLSINYRRPYFW